MRVVGIIVTGIVLIAVAVLFTRPPAENPAPDDSSPSTARVTVHLKEEASALDIKIIPREVLEDSRCPLDVQCVWAGTVRLATTLYTASGSGSAPQEFTLGKPITTETREVELVAVHPVPREGVPIEPASYEFVFEVRVR